MGLRLGYARGSTDDQNLDLQRDVLTRYGCAAIYAVLIHKLKGVLTFVKPISTVIELRSVQGGA